MKVTDEQIELYVQEDHAASDYLVKHLISPKSEITGSFIAKATGVVSGVTLAMSILKKIAPSIRYNIVKEDGKHVNRGDVIVTIRGKAGDVIKSYRIAQNFMERLSGISSSINKYVLELSGYTTKVVLKRSTTPGYRELENEAVQNGGGEMFSRYIDDKRIITCEHIAAVGSITDAATMYEAKNRANVPYWIEVEDEDEFYEASLTGCLGIILCNFSNAMIEEALEMNQKGKILALDNKNITVPNIRSFAKYGFAYIFVPATTTAYKALDIDFKTLEKRRKLK